LLINHEPELRGARSIDRVFDEAKVENALAQFKLLKMRESKAYAIAIELQIGNDCK